MRPLAALLPLLSFGCSETELRSLQQPEVAPDSEAVDERGDEAVPGEPIAEAGADLEVQPLDVVTLDGTLSYDPAGLAIVEMRWSLVAAPAGSTASLSDPAAARPEFFADLAGDFVFELTVKNEAGVWDSTPDTVVITAVPLDGFYVELSWDAAVDLDLHLLNGTSGLFGAGDCNYCNMTPSWGAAGRTDDPSLDWDAIDGWGPETITIDAPSAGTYNVQVHYYGENGSPTCSGPCNNSTATVNVYLGGVLAASYSQVFSDQGQVWDVADIVWPAGQVVPIGGLGTTNKTSCD